MQCEYTSSQSIDREALGDVPPRGSLQVRPSTISQSLKITLSVHGSTRWDSSHPASSSVVIHIPNLVSYLAYNPPRISCSRINPSGQLALDRHTNRNPSCVLSASWIWMARVRVTGRWCTVTINNGIARLDAERVSRQERDNVRLHAPGRRYFDMGAVYRWGGGTRCSVDGRQNV